MSFNMSLLDNIDFSNFSKETIEKAVENVCEMFGIKDEELKTSLMNTCLKHTNPTEEKLNQSKQNIQVSVEDYIRTQLTDDVLYTLYCSYVKYNNTPCYIFKMNDSSNPYFKEIFKDYFEKYSHAKYYFFIVNEQRLDIHFQDDMLSILDDDDINKIVSYVKLGSDNLSQSILDKCSIKKSIEGYYQTDDSVLHVIKKGENKYDVIKITSRGTSTLKDISEYNANALLTKATKSNKEYFDTMKYKLFTDLY